MDFVKLGGTRGLFVDVPGGVYPIFFVIVKEMSIELPDRYVSV